MAIGINCLHNFIKKFHYKNSLYRKISHNNIENNDMDIYFKNKK